MTQGYSAQFKVKPSGEFYFAHYSSGVAPDCPSVSFFDQMVGLAEFSEGRLTLRPRERTLSVSHCERSGSSAPPESAQPSEFQIGQDAAFQEFIKRWGRYDVDFVDFASNTYRFPECCGEHRFLRFREDGYELGFSFLNAQLEGVCKKDILYFERGQSRVMVTEQRGLDTSQGDLLLQATEARFVVRIRECGDDDGVTEYAVTPQVGYYRFSYTTPAGGESLMLGCSYPLSHFSRFTVCYDANPWVTLSPK